MAGKSRSIFLVGMCFAMGVVLRDDDAFGQSVSFCGAGHWHAGGPVRYVLVRKPAAYGAELIRSVPTRPCACR